jgi:AcrR family transcriptional regulator
MNPPSRASPTPAQPPSSGRVALTRERIVEAALALIDRDGLAAFSARKLGAALGVEAMSIYHHFPSKQHVLDALVDHAIASVPLDRVGDPQTRLRRLADDYRAMASRFPRLYPLIALHRLNTPTGVRLIEHVLSLVRALTPDDESAAREFRAVGYYLIGAALEETSGYAQGPSAAEPVSDEYIAAHCPHLAAAAPYFRKPHWEATFALGLDALLEGLHRGRR